MPAEHIPLPLPDTPPDVSNQAWLALGRYLAVAYSNTELQSLIERVYFTAMSQRLPSELISPQEYVFAVCALIRRQDGRPQPKFWSRLKLDRPARIQDIQVIEGLFQGEPVVPVEDHEFVPSSASSGNRPKSWLGAAVTVSIVGLAIVLTVDSFDTTRDSTTWLSREEAELPLGDHMLPQPTIPESPAMSPRKISTPTSNGKPARGADCRNVREGEARPGGTAIGGTLEFVIVPSGQSCAGSLPEECTTTSPTEAIRKDCLDREMRTQTFVASFEIAKTETTRGQWEIVMGTKALTEEGLSDSLSAPVYRATWEDAVLFMNRLTEIENQRPGVKRTVCYFQEPVLKAWNWDRDCTGYRLPTEIEWEYAARAGTDSPYSFGIDDESICTHANLFDQTHAVFKFREKRTGPHASCSDGEAGISDVGRYSPNPWGIYDMHGNVFEWVWDWYTTYRSDILLNGYAGPDHNAYGRHVIRGGSFNSYPYQIRSSFRDAGISDRRSAIGFRCVRAAHQA